MSKALGLLFGAMWTGHGGVMPVIYLGRWPFMALSDLRPAWTTALKLCQPKERYMLKTDLVWALEILNATNLRFIRLPHRVSHYTVLNIVLNFLLPLASGSPLTFLSAAITDGSHSLTAVPASLVLKLESMLPPQPVSQELGDDEFQSHRITSGPGSCPSMNHLSCCG